MFTNKNKLIGLIALVVVIVLVVSAAIALIADSKIKSDAAEADKKIAALQSELAAAQKNINTLTDKLAKEAATKAELQATVKELNTLKSNLESQIASLKDDVAGNKGTIDTLKSTLDTVNGLLADANAKIEVLEAMTGAWDEVTPKVYDKLFAVTATYKDAMAKEALVDGFDGDALTEAYNDTWTAIIRARNDEQLDAAVNGFNKYVEENITNRSYTHLFGKLVNAIPEVVYGGEEDDAARIATAYTYYNTVVVGKPEAEVACAELKAALDAYAAKYEELKHNSYLNAYLEALNNLPALFHAVDNKAELDAVVAAWNALVAEYPAEQKDARHIAMEARLVTIADVILPALDEMNALINKLDKDADGKLAITEENRAIVAKLVELHADFAAVVVEADPYYTGLGIADYATELRAGVEALWSIYNAFLAATTDAKLGIGSAMDLVDRVAAIEAAEALKAQLTNDDLALIAVYYGKTTAEIVDPFNAGVANIEAAKAIVVDIEKLIVDIKAEIDRLIKVEDARDPAEYAYGVRAEHLVTLEGLVAKLTAYVGADNVNSTIGEEYVAKLAEVRLYPAQNEAYDLVNEYYNELFDIANKDGKAELTVEKGQLFSAIAAAKTQDDIDAVLDTYKDKLDACVA